MRLDIGIFGIIDLLQPVDGQLFDLVHDLAAAVIAFSGIALCILVGADRTHRLQHIIAYIILGGNQLESRRLPFPFVPDQIENLKILFHMRFR